VSIEILPEEEKKSYNPVFENLENYIDERMELRYNEVRLMLEYRERGKLNYSVFADRERKRLCRSYDQQSG